MNSVWSARTPTPTELHIGNKSSLQLPRPQVNTQATPDKAMTTSGCKHLQPHRPISNISNMSLNEAACAPETS
jgi:hypothetical protein